MGRMNEQHRLERAQRFVAEQGLAGLIIGTGPEMAYFTGHAEGSHERLTCLVITADSHRIVAPMTDLAGLPGVTGWRDGQDAHALATEILPPGPVALGSSLTTHHVLRFGELIDAPLTPLPAGLFDVKEDAEIAELRRAGQAIDRVHAQAPELLLAGRTEADVAAELNHLILAEHDAVDFVIVGSGPNGANPHHSFSDRVLLPGDPVVVDLGGTLNSGYHSDCTRTYVVAGAQAPEDFSRAYEAVRAGYLAALEKARPGVMAGEVDGAARTSISEAGWGEYFTHRTGHGIGLSTHEEPFIIAGSERVLERGMAFSIEPGVYVPGRWGIRIEDIVVVGEDLERLNVQPTMLG